MQEDLGKVSKDLSWAFRHLVSPHGGLSYKGINDVLGTLNAPSWPKEATPDLRTRRSPRSVRPASRDWPSSAPLRSGAPARGYVGFVPSLCCVILAVLTGFPRPSVKGSLMLISVGVLTHAGGTSGTVLEAKPPTPPRFVDSWAIV